MRITDPNSILTQLRETYGNIILTNSYPPKRGTGIIFELDKITTKNTKEKFQNISEVIDDMIKKKTFAYDGQIGGGTCTTSSQDASGVFT